MTVPASGTIVEIGSFKGKSTVMLGSLAGRYGLGRVVAIDPHAGLGYLGVETPHQDPTYDQFLSSLKAARVEEHVEVRRSFSREVAVGWDRPIRLLWIDGDHSYQGCKEDFELFSPYLVEGAVVALHDTLNAFEGPIRVFVEQILRGGGICSGRAVLCTRSRGVSIDQRTARATGRKGEDWKRVPRGLYLS